METKCLGHRVCDGNFQIENERQNISHLVQYEAERGIKYGE